MLAKSGVGETVEVKLLRGKLECSVMRFLNLYPPGSSYICWSHLANGIVCHVLVSVFNLNVYAKSEKCRSSGGTVEI